MHLHRMNVDCKYMEKVIEDLQAKIRLVLSRKMGRPRKADQILDDLLKQMTRRFKFQSTNQIGNQLRQQLVHWRDHYAELEQKYLATLEIYSEKLRLAAALQADHRPTKKQRDLSKHFGSYHPSEYKRDVVRLRIIRTQQIDQIKNLRNEIKRMKMKPISPLPPFCEPTQEPAKEPVDEFQIFEFPPREDQKPLKFYPRRCDITSREKSNEVALLLCSIMKEMAINPSQGTALMEQITAFVPKVMSGKMPRHEVIDKIMFKWLPTPERKKRTVSFDLLNQLLTILIEQQMQDTELGDVTTDAEESLEATIIIAGAGIDPQAGIQTAIVKLLSGMLPMAPISELSKNDTIVTLVAVLVEKIPQITEHNSDVDLEAIDLNDIAVKLKDKVENMEELTKLIITITDGLKAQQLSEEEQAFIQAEVEREFSKDYVSSEKHSPSCTEGAASQRTGQADMDDSDEDEENDIFDDI